MLFKVYKVPVTILESLTEASKRIKLYMKVGENKKNRDEDVALEKSDILDFGNDWVLSILSKRSLLVK